jgi:hypothetical protein
MALMASTSSRGRFQFSLRSLMIGVTLLAAGCFFVRLAWPVVWHFSLEGEKGRTRLVFEEPKLSIVFLGLPDAGGFGGSDDLRVSGWGHEYSVGGSSTGFSSEYEYSWGVAEFRVCDRALRITNGGKKLTYKGETIDIPGDSPVELVIDASGHCAVSRNLGRK